MYESSITKITHKRALIRLGCLFAVRLSISLPCRSMPSSTEACSCPDLGNIPLFASSPSPVWTQAEERHGGNAFQHRLPRTAFYRWPAAPHHMTPWPH